MNYEQMRKVCTPRLKVTPYYQLVATRDNIQLHSKWDSPNSDISPFTINPDETVTIYRESNSVNLALGQIGLGCDISRSSSRKAIKVYRHKLVNTYIFTPGMKVRLSDGTPIDAKRLDDCLIDKEKRKELAQKIKEFKVVFLAYGRLKEKTEQKPYRHVGFSTYSPHREKGSQILAEAIRTVGTVAFNSKITELELAGWNWPADFQEASRLFENMIRRFTQELYAKFNVSC